MIPKTIQRLVDDFHKLPGIGPKTAQRLAFYILRMPSSEVTGFAEDLTKAKNDLVMCSVCKNVDEESPCHMCKDSTRNQRQIAVVSSPLDLLALDKTGYRGVYHVLHGVIDPLNGVGPEELYIDDLVNRVQKAFSLGSVEVILSTSSSLEGESTAMYINRLLREASPDKTALQITRLARGLPVGGDVEYADEVTLSKALEHRTNM